MASTANTMPRIAGTARLEVDRDDAFPEVGAVGVDVDVDEVEDGEPMLPEVPAALGNAPKYDTRL